MYKLLKDINHPFVSVKAGEIKSLRGWLDEFDVDQLSTFEALIKNNPEWFERVEAN